MSEEYLVVGHTHRTTYYHLVCIIHTGYVCVWTTGLFIIAKQAILVNIIFVFAKKKRSLFLYLPPLKVKLS